MLEICDSVFTTVIKAGSSPTLFSIVSLVKAYTLRSLVTHDFRDATRISPFAHLLLPTETAVVVPLEPFDNRMTDGISESLKSILLSRIMEAKIHLCRVS